MILATNTFIDVSDNAADLADVSLGIVGPSALGEQTQKTVHTAIDATEPRGWNKQISDELVFQISRARLIRAWHSQNQMIDLLFMGNISTGTVSSSASLGAMIRFGSRLESSFATVLYNRSRTSNPSAVKGWNIFVGTIGKYIFKQIFTDGNTFKESRSISYDNESLGVQGGISLSYRDYALSLAVADTNVIEKGSRVERLEDLTQ